MEFKLITDLSQLPHTVEFNVEELKSELTEKLAYYDNLVVTEDALRDAKSDKAKLNKLRTAIDTKRKEVKKACLAPYEEFERQCRDILDMIDRPINSIDQQIKVFEQKELDAKYQEIKSHFDYIMTSEECSGLPIVLDKIINPKWQNKTAKIETLKTEITDSVAKIVEDVNGIRYAYGGTPHLTAALNRYYEAYDAGAAHLYANKLIDEQHKREEQELARQKTPAPSQTRQNASQAPSEPEPQVSAPTPQNAVQSTPDPSESVPAVEKRYTCKFKATGTIEQIRNARDYMLSIGLEIESIKD